MVTSVRQETREQMLRRLANKAREHGVQLRKHLALDIDGMFHAKIEVEATPDIAIERHLHLRRDGVDGWLIFSVPNGAVEQGGDIASGDIAVHDPTICAFLDALYRLIADPAGVGKVTFSGPQVSTKAA